jgi:type IV pilus assembly protein PilO
METKSSSLKSFFESIEQLSKVQRMLISAGVFVLLIGAFVYFLYLPNFEKIDRLEKNLTQLEKELETARRNAADLEKFQAKMREAEAQYKTAMRALPEKQEIPSLLTSISKSGQDVGLEFLLFEPKGEQRKEFYAEIPVAINVKGDYHNLALFFDKVARLNRIVNIRNINMSRGKNGSDLNTSCTAVTYKFVDSPPPDKGKGAKKSKKSKGKGK